MVEKGFKLEGNLSETPENYQEMEDFLKEDLQKRLPKIEQSERAIEEIKDLDDKVLARYERVRNYKPSGKENDLWLVVDFDDVVFHTTTFNNNIYDKLAEEFDIGKEEFDQIYEGSKEENDFGKNLLVYDTFKEKLEKKYPDAGKVVDDMLNNFNPQRYIDHGIKRALQALKRHSNVRISILTFGDFDYQKMKVDGTDMDDIVDEIIYTERSKGDTLESFKNKFYDDSGKGENTRPIIITVDDNKSHVDEYQDISSSYDRLVNVRYNNPQAKRYKDGKTYEKNIVFTDKEINNAAVNLWKMGESYRDRNVLQTDAEANFIKEANAVRGIFDDKHYADDSRHKIGEQDIEGFIKNAPY